MMNEDTLRLLDLLRARNIAQDSEGLFPQLIEPSNSTPQSAVPTLVENVFRPLTPMLEARFFYAGNWANAWTGNHWLGLSDMKRAWTDPKMIEQIALRKEYYDLSVLNRTGYENISLFGWDEQENYETYLEWKEGTREPAICYHSTVDEYEFANLNEYLVWLTDW